MRNIFFRDVSEGARYWVCGVAGVAFGVLSAVYMFDYASMKTMGAFIDGFDTGYAKGQQEGFREAQQSDTQEAYCAALWFEKQHRVGGVK